MLIRCVALLLLLPLSTLSGQTQPAGSVQATGTATVSGIAPDQAQLTVGVVTMAKTAQDAASQNATQTTAVQTALQGVLGTKGEIHTIAYSLNPNYSSGGTGTPPVITGYTASNTVQVTVRGAGNLNLVGPLIDAGNNAGANNIGGPSYSLQDSDPYRLQALTAASKQAMAHAGAIATGLGVKLGSVIAAQEGSSVMPIVNPTTAGAGVSTPILTGTVSVSATVTVSVAIQ